MVVRMYLQYGVLVLVLGMPKSRVQYHMLTYLVRPRLNCSSGFASDIVPEPGEKWTSPDSVQNR